MLAGVKSCAVTGIDAYIVEVEVDISFGLPVFNIVGLPETSVKESRDRVKSAIKNSGYSFPMDRITVNLAPGDMKKEGTGFDLPVAMGILAASELVSADALSGYFFTGEVSLDGRIRPVTGILPAAIAVKQSGFKGMVVPFDNRAEASVVQGLNIFPVKSLSQVVEFFSGFKQIEPFKSDLTAILNKDLPGDGLDFSEVRGQNHAKRALEIAAAGAHNLLLTGPPGSGKSMLAKRVPSILPKFTFDEAIETTRIYSVAGFLKDKMPLVTKRPFRAPHHTVSDAGLVGGGRRPVPGEVSLAHNGVLFLDELPEFKRRVLEALRQPMEDGTVTISRVDSRVSFPASFMLVAAMNPCPCGYFGDLIRECTCSPVQIQRYNSRISGPMLDRIDIHVEVPSVPYRELSKNADAETSVEIRKRVSSARDVQNKRFKGKKIFCNADMDSRHLKEYCRLDAESASILETAVDKLGLSARAYSRVLKIARTIADLEKESGAMAAKPIMYKHVAEAIQYRALDRKK
ncbi:MAG: YifB family Mg chelatase-like AAA ATPase [Thermodesulfobacteriota bacterium]|nr:YifB family Mg chelatase-like AAA ATPase [Thermodesulfobacteriota bacterium]